MQNTIKMLTLIALVLPVAAKADDITFSVIGAHEYELPVDYTKPFNAIVQYGEFNDNSQAWNANGKTVNAGGGALYEGLTKYVFFFKIPGISDVGFAYEVIQPEVAYSDGHPGEAGFGDTLTGPAMWFKPTSSSVLGIQSFFALPDGMPHLSGHGFENLTSFFYDYQWEKISVTGDIGGVFRGNSHVSDSPVLERSTVWHSNTNVTWKATALVEPFLAIDWQTNDSLKYAQTGQRVADSGANEFTLGGGLHFNATKNFAVDIRYQRGITGDNTTLTNAVYLRLGLVF